MVWKKKEKELTKQEATRMAKEQLAPFWYGSPPLFAGIKASATQSVHALDPEFSTGNWLLFFLDPTDLSKDIFLDYALEWYARFSPYGVKAVLILRATYQPFLDSGYLKEYSRRNQLPFPLTIDSDSSLFKGFQIKKAPMFVFLSKNLVVFQEGKIEEFQKTEQKLHHFLRKSDPGLPLPPFFYSSKAYIYDGGKLDFGQHPPLNWKLVPASTLVRPEVDDFEESPILTLQPNLLYMGGKWKQEAEALIPEENSCFIEFLSPSDSLYLIAKALSKTTESGKIILEINQAAVHEIFLSSSAKFDDQGKSFLPVRNFDVYPTLDGLSEENRRITLRFPYVTRVPIQLYGIRFGKSGLS